MGIPHWPHGPPGWPAWAPAAGPRRTWLPLALCAKPFRDEAFSQGGALVSSVNRDGGWFVPGHKPAGRGRETRATAKVVPSARTTLAGARKLHSRPTGGAGWPAKQVNKRQARHGRAVNASTHLSAPPRIVPSRRKFSARGVQGLNLPAFSRSGGLGKVDQRLARQFGHARIGVPQQRHQHADPVQFTGKGSDYTNGLRHRAAFLRLILFSASRAEL